MKSFYSILFAITTLLMIHACDESDNTIIIEKPDDPTDTTDTDTTDIDTTDVDTVVRNLKIATWNIEFFPKTSDAIDFIDEVLDTTTIDVFAVQEINDLDVFRKFGNREDWAVQALNIDGSLELGFLYRESELTVVKSAYTILENESSLIRPPVVIEFRHSSGFDFYLINIHLKCCDDGEETRESALLALKEYMDEELSNQKVILLGDYNDELSDGAFDIFDNDDNYRFADGHIPSLDDTFWSYPSWPSHIDHILITDEFFDQIVACHTQIWKSVYLSYYEDVSDHQPVMVEISAQ